mmetsp:Transcript_299/g.277  ORF Transcript_299/g.277 Transcript_299/m.277 type:complete len:239 (-) Transcript_299:23-739(-)
MSSSATILNNKQDDDLATSTSSTPASIIMDDFSDASDYTTEAGEIYEDIREALTMARVQGVIPPVRIAKILAGEGVGEFTSTATTSTQHHTTSWTNTKSAPLSVGLDYIGSILDETSKEITRLKNDVQEYNQMCVSMEAEIQSLTMASYSQEQQREIEEEKKSSSVLVHGLTIDELYNQMLDSSYAEDTEETNTNNNTNNNSSSTKVRKETEEFWRDMDQSEDRFETIARFFGKDIIH